VREGLIYKDTYVWPQANPDRDYELEFLFNAPAGSQTFWIEAMKYGSKGAVKAFVETSRWGEDIQLEEGGGEFKWYSLPTAHVSEAVGPVRIRCFVRTGGDLHLRSVFFGDEMPHGVFL
jgi:hypothetical protein